MIWHHSPEFEFSDAPVYLDRGGNRYCMNYKMSLLSHFGIRGMGHNKVSRATHVGCWYSSLRSPFPRTTTILREE